MAAAADTLLLLPFKDPCEVTLSIEGVKGVDEEDTGEADETGFRGLLAAEAVAAEVTDLKCKAAAC